MQLTITINIDNAAFEDNDEQAADILENLARWMRSYDLKEYGPKQLMDVNGNTVGHAVVTD